MHDVRRQILIAVLLLVQVWAGIAGGRTMCVPVGACNEHQTDVVEQACSGDTSFQGDCCDGGHQHGPVTPVGHLHEPCGCHVHIPSPNDPITSRTSTEREEARVTLASPNIITAVLWPIVPERIMVMSAVIEQRQPPAARVLKTTRLII